MRWWGLLITGVGCGFQHGALPSDALTAGADADAARDAALPNHVIARWELDETAGTLAEDSEPQPIDLTIEAAISPTPPTMWRNGALDITSPVRIHSGTAATKIISRIQSTRTFTLEAWVKPASSTQGGPARIVTVSRDGQESTFTLGQQSATWIFRVRRGSSDAIGRPELISSDVIAVEPTLTHVVATYAAGVRVLYVDGVENARDMGFDDLLLNPAHRAAIASEPSGDPTNFRPWLGELHRILIHDRALDGPEVAARHAAGP